MNALVSQNPLKLVGLGIASPGEPVTTETLIESLQSHCGTHVARQARAIASRLGIKRRYLSRDLSRKTGSVLPQRDAPTLCRLALESALSSSNTNLDNIEYLIGHTASPHTLLPPNIAWVSDSLSFDSPYVELRQACTGFANGLQMASGLIVANQMSHVAIVGSEVGSPYFTADESFIDREQLVNYVQMGDGAAAAIVGPDDGNGRQIISDLFIGQIGNGKSPGLSLKGGGSSEPYCEFDLPKFEHSAAEVKRHGPALFDLGIDTIRERGYKLDDFKFIIPHQANGRLAAPLARRFGIDPDQIFVTADKYGNLGSAAIWVALHELIESDTLERGDKVLILGAEATKYIFGGFVYTH